MYICVSILIYCNYVFCREYCSNGWVLGARLEPVSVLNPYTVVQSNLIKKNFRGPAKFVLIIRSSAYQDMGIYINYYSEPNLAR